MQTIFRILRLTAMLLLAVTLGLHSSLAAGKTIRIGTGSILESYYYIGLKICRYIEQGNPDVKCVLVPTNGSVDSLSMLENGELDFAFVQANFAVDAYKGEGYFAKRKIDNLVQHIRLHNEVFTVIVKDDDNLLIYEDIQGKKISNGPPFSDSSETYRLLSEIYNFENKPEDIELSHEKYAKYFCNGKIDAILMMTGHPNALVSNIASRCDSEFVKISEDKIDELVRKHPEFTKVVLDAGSYPDISGKTSTIGVSGVFVSKNDVDRNIVSSFNKYLVNDIADFRSSHAVLYELQDDHFLSGFALPKYEPGQGSGSEDKNKINTDEGAAEAAAVGAVNSNFK